MIQLFVLLAKLPADLTCLWHHHYENCEPLRCERKKSGKKLNCLEDMMELEHMALKSKKHSKLLQIFFLVLIKWRLTIYPFWTSVDYKNVSSKENMYTNNCTKGSCKGKQRGLNTLIIFTKTHHFVLAYYLNNINWTRMVISAEYHHTLYMEMVEQEVKGQCESMTWWCFGCQEEYKRAMQSIGKSLHSAAI